MGTIVVGVLTVLTVIGIAAFMTHAWRNRHDWQKHEDLDTNLRYRHPSFWGGFPISGGFYLDDEDKNSEPPKSKSPP